MAVTAVVVMLFPRLVRLPKYSAYEAMSPLDPRRGQAHYGESMVAVSRVERRLALPTAVLMAFVLLWGAQRTGWSWLIAFLIVPLLVGMDMATTSPRIPTNTDFRRPILVLRSYRQRDVTTFETQGDEYLRGGFESQIWSMALELWDWPRVVFFLGEETLGGHMHAIEIRTNDDNWEAALKQAIPIAWFIVVFPASTPSCIQEMTLLAKSPVRGKVIVCMPPGERAAKGWKEVRTTLAEIGFNLPEHISGGMFFLPNADFSPIKSVALAGEIDWRRLEDLAPPFGALPDGPLDNVLPRPFFESGRSDLPEGGLLSSKYPSRKTR